MMDPLNRCAQKEESEYVEEEFVGECVDAGVGRTSGVGVGVVEFEPDGSNNNFGFKLVLVLVVVVVVALSGRLGVFRIIVYHTFFMLDVESRVV